MAYSITHGERMIRFGIAGFGLHAVKRLMSGFQRAQHCRVTALSRRTLPLAQASAREHGIEHSYTSTAE
jgi:1,5-anhydro-D-fructose reductase (1,5-anhydro-D-mannitol-forming)